MQGMYSQPHTLNLQFASHEMRLVSEQTSRITCITYMNSCVKAIVSVIDACGFSICGFTSMHTLLLDM